MTKKTYHFQYKKVGTDGDRRFVGEILGRHFWVNKYLDSAYVRHARSYGIRAANEMIRELDKALFTPVLPRTAAMDDEDIKNNAEAFANHCRDLFRARGAKLDIPGVVAEVTEYVEKQGFKFPLEIKRLDSAEEIARKSICALERVCDSKWWRRSMRVVFGRKVEATLRKEGFVRRGKSPYVSRWAFQRWKGQQRRNAAIVGSLEAVQESKNGDVESVCDLKACVDSSISNPRNRRNELMVRMRGFEEVATGLGLTGLFFTLTCPSKFHAQLHTGGRNSRFNGATPIEAMEHLNGTWTKIRAEWARRGIKTFGFRVCEPHHDGTPHFHLLLFFNPAEIDAAKKVFIQYAFKIDPLEPGAEKYRCDVKEIQPEKGTAAGYIAKYVAKNIDGFGVDGDDESGGEAEESAALVRAWASIWGIRQFQQIGSVSVTVWRELRRQADMFPEEIPEKAEELRETASRGDWAKFVELMGGPHVRRDSQTLRPFRPTADIQNKYGEEIQRLIGLWLAPVGHAIARCFIPTRNGVWKVRQKDFKGVFKGGGEAVPLGLVSITVRATQR